MPSRREVLQAGAACCVTAATSCGAGTASEPSGRVELGEVGRLRRELEKLPARLRHFPRHKIYLVLWEPDAGQEAAYPDSAGGFLALTQRCPHLGCTLPLCEGSENFECPCHGSRFNRVGEYQFGPAPNGQVRFRLSVVATRYGREHLLLHKDEPALGAPRGTRTITQEQQGNHCVG